MVFGIKCLFLLKLINKMSQETLEISVNVDEQFDVDFNLLEGLFGFILRIFDLNN